MHISTLLSFLFLLSELCELTKFVLTIQTGRPPDLFPTIIKGSSIVFAWQQVLRKSGINHVLFWL